MMKSAVYTLAIDIGGTQIKAGILSSEGEIIALERMATPANSNPESVIRKILILRDLLFQNTLEIADKLIGTGISIAAFIKGDGQIMATAHLSQEWVGYNLHSRLIGDLPMPHYFCLDTPAPTLGEAYFGAGKGEKDFVYVTVSTGIGAGIIADGHYLIGGLGWAGGIGHTIIDENSDRICPGCGNHGCLETFSAKQGIVTNALEMIEKYPDSLLAEQFRFDQNDITPKVIADIAQKGDQASIEVFEMAGHALGIGLTNLVDIVSPNKVIIGGGIALSGDLLLGPARQIIRQRAFPPKNRDVEVVQAALGDLSGLYGAAAMVFNNIQINP